MEDRCVVCGDIVPEGRKVCSICSGEFNEVPAVSRRDEKLSICPRCATKEALDDARALIGKGMNDRQWEDYKEQILNMIYVANKHSKI